MKIKTAHDALLKIEGRSGCSLMVFESNGKTLVRKVSSSLAYNSRLIQQLKKQSDFNQFNLLEAFGSPKVISIGTTNQGLNYFDMQYVTGEKFSDFLCRISVQKIQVVIKLLIDYLEYCFFNANYIYPPIDVIQVKINEIQTRLNANTNFGEEFKQKIYLFLRANIPNSKLPQFCCHGDLTFSNMLFCPSGKIYLIDFLDSFIESPLIDLVKLRQDTRFFWSVEIDSNLESDKICKVLQILSYIDKSLEQYLSKKGKDVYNWYQYLEIFNLVRIMPYVDKEQEVNFLNKHIEELLLIP